MMIYDTNDSDNDHNDEINNDIDNDHNDEINNDNYNTCCTKCW